jgi:hypothetical protein
MFPRYMTDAARLTESLADAARLIETLVECSSPPPSLIPPPELHTGGAQTELAVKLYGVPREDDAGSGAQSELLVKLRVPEATAVCPLSLDLIGGSDVDEFDGFLLDTAHPQHREIVLPCGHSFSSGYIAIAWLTSRMRCPLCRAGLDTALDPGCLPAVWHTRAQDYVTRWNTTAQMEAIASDHDMALRDSLMETTNIQLYMCVYIIQLDGHVETSLVQFAPNNHNIPTDPSEDLVLMCARASIRRLSGLFRRSQCVGFNMVAFARCVGDGVELVEIANSGLVTIPLRNEEAPYAVQTVSVRYPSTQQDSSAYMGLASFCTEWLQCSNNMMDTLTSVSFRIPFCDMALIVGGLFTSGRG